MSDTVRISCYHGDEYVPVYATDGMFAVTKAFDNALAFTVTHLPSGRSAGRFGSRYAAESYMAACVRVAARRHDLWQGAEFLGDVSELKSDLEELRRVRAELGGL